LPQCPALLSVPLLLLVGCGAQQVALDVGPPDPADRDACRSLVRALPRSVADQEPREVRPDEGWGAAWGDPAIVLTCGSSPPEGYDRVSTCTTVDGVDWYLPEKPLESGADSLTMTTVNRAQYVRVVLPSEYWPPATALADLSGAVAATTDRTGRCR
jgi:hypothetical protein